ncbi:MAG: hypothetical protein DME34_02535 [Verrucomicrobia bacterium]|nr:MAG: hypothetical protein DME34_02535 [Verrucomicrobiota bacterium]
MRFRKRPSVVVLLVAAFLLFVFGALSTPLLVSSVLRLWIWWKARQEHLSVTIDKIEAPLLRPVVIRGLRLETAQETTLANVPFETSRSTGCEWKFAAAIRLNRR